MRIPVDVNLPSTGHVWTSPAWLSILMASKSMFQQQLSQHRKRGEVNDRAQEVVDLILCCISVLGALSIIIPYCMTRHSRKLRHSLILGLATSDLASSLIIIATSCFALAGGNLSNATRFCGFAGYMFQVTIWTQNLWNLSIAIITYMILVHPLHTFNTKVERHLLWMWPLFWSIALTVNAIPWGITGFGNVGGYCSFAPNKGGAYFAALYQFVPRALVVLVVIVLYTHLFFFLRRVNMFNRASSNSRQISSAGRSGADSHRLRMDDFDYSTKNSAQLTQGSSQSSTTRKFKWWKRSGSESMENESSRQGSSSTQGNSSFGAPKTMSPTTVLEMTDYAEVSPKTKPSEIPSSPTNSTHQPVTAIVPIIRAPPTAARRPSVQRAAGSERSLASTRRKSASQALHGLRSHPDPEKKGLEDEEEEEGDNDKQGLLEILQPMSLRRDVKDFGMTSAPREHLKHYSLSPAGLDFMKKAREEDLSEKTNGQEEEFSYETALGKDWTWGMAVGGGGGGGGGGGDMIEQSQLYSDSTSPSSPNKDVLRSKIGWKKTQASQTQTGTNSTTSADEHGVEAIGSTLNRQASILLLLYPLAYSLLFSISIIRIIVDISDPDGSAQSKAQRSGNLLHAISRWTIFAQGIIDAIIFQVVERSFRMRMKRKRRIAAGENLPDFWIDAWLKKISGFFKR